MDFAPADGRRDVYEKVYPRHNGYTIRVDVANERIEYVDTAADENFRIVIGNGTTSNFSHPENFVILDCVVRLLDTGYAPNAIELEKVYPSGRGHSGQLDILVKHSGGKPFLMIECKTWGTEYSKERDKMLKDGGQLFTYYKNATAASYLCLYASHLVDGKTQYVNSIVDVQDEWARLSETKDIYEHWNKLFKDNGIFESYAAPYNIVHKRLTYGMLQNMKADDSGKIYNHIMEILRHNGISDKPNAFNKLLNLFVCKIIDEDKNPDDELQFQCWHGLSDEKLQMTLNDLYKEGMWRFLEIRVIDHSESDVDKVLQELGIGDTAHKKKLMDMFSDTRLKKSPNFAFVEVQDEKTFQLNAKVVREIVELLQHYKFRYEQKHEFLGNFFEKMLNTSMKQEAGQFFTPVPIARFIISSLPLRELVQGRIDGKEADPLPAAIDYACGSGHFLTEFMSKMQTIIECADVAKASPSVRGKLNSWRGDVKFSWAREYVYGIDFDNRLVKTAKVSAFFNGDGEATIVWGNGLDNFERSEEYRDKLRNTLSGSKKDNGQFDILISNPPYSVQAFKTVLKHGEESFDLYGSLTNNSSEIECLFVERMKQLLKVGGWAGVILPSSMFSNGGIYSRTREIIFKYFKVKSIVELGSGTFMKTGTNTIVLFLERRPDNDHEKITQAISKFFQDGLDVTVAGIERAYSKFVANVYDGLAFDDYKSLVCGMPSKAMQSHELWTDYVKDYGRLVYDQIISEEKAKLEAYLIDKLNGKAIADRKVKPADITKKVKIDVENFICGRTEFLSQEFLSDVAKFITAQYDGISITDFESFLRHTPNERIQTHYLFADYLSRVCKRCITSEDEKMLYFLLTYEQNVVVVKSGQKQDEKAFLGYEFSERRGYEGIKLLPAGTKLFDESGNPLNPQKVNSYIYNAFLGKSAAEIGEAVSNHVSYGRMCAFFDYGTRKFDKRVNLSKKTKMVSRYPLVALSNLLSISRGASPRPISKYLTNDISGVNWIKIGDAAIEDKYINGANEKITKEGALKSKAVSVGDMVVSNSMSTGRPYILNISGCIHDGWLLLSEISTNISKEYLYYILCSANVQEQLRIESLGGVVQNLNIERVSGIKIPLPPLGIQRQIVAELEALEREETDTRVRFATAKDSIAGLMKNSGEANTKLSDFAEYVTARIDFSELSATNYIGVDNLLQNVEGRTDSNYVPISGKVTAYDKGDILLSNIRPYLKKAWLADRVGGCSNDVLAIRIDTDKALPKYVFCHLSSDEFFAYEMEHIGSGVKMPRADKAKVLEYKIPLPPLEKQRECVAAIEKREAEISQLRARLDELKIAKSAVLDKYL
ncbi:MAG: N-6 DNA methylase [Acidaminococcales bacterium]|jgi:type I restriction-modification system DNA methylase subunit/restriction endonuclease S subunit|nr:N-6 DNA methylase [Acidaminococcales bacterium]